jgi:farnesyl-diphosphate farnesyltransferase
MKSSPPSTLHSLGQSDLLKAVSRSFYLSMRFLPPAMRDPIAVGYLAARLSDTVADAPGLEQTRRLFWLAELEAVASGAQGSGQSLADMGAELALLLNHSGERTLVEAAGRLPDWLDELSPDLRGPVNQVFTTILQGQRWDLHAFQAGQWAGCEGGDDLLRYTYQVAGCVGEFWTEVGYTSLGARFADLEEKETMMQQARFLGQALQLVNVLRDVGADLALGRCYLPAEELRAVGWDGASRPTAEVLKPAFDHWLGVCRDFLEESQSYIRKLRDPRVIFCTRLPQILAHKTTDLLAQAGIERVLAEKIKVSRGAVAKSAAQAIFL